MKMPRPSTQHDRLALKAATYRALQLAGGVDGFSPSTRVEGPALSKYHLPAHEQYFLPIDIALDLDRAIGSPVVLDALAERAGYRLVPLDAKGGRDGLPNMADLAALAQEAADVARDVARAEADGRITLREYREVSATMERAVHHIREMQQQLLAALVGAGER